MNLINEIEFYQIFDMIMLLLIGMGPKIANLLMNGNMDKHGPPEDDAMEHIGLYQSKA